VSYNTKVTNANCGNVSHILSLLQQQPKVKAIYFMYFNAFFAKTVITSRTKAALRKELCSSVLIFVG
jgi:hypothetical protein